MHSFCEGCGQAHTCDRSCGYACEAPPAAGDGHRRQLQFIPAVIDNSRCEWDLFDDSLRAIEETCCAEDGSCASGLPETCPYDCGQLYVPFLEQCREVLYTQIEHDNATITEFETFSSQCLELDPKTMVMAIHNSVCLVCGDGEIEEPEECDDGFGRNSDEPNARCRTDCRLAACGDGVVDAGEDCDQGPLNSDEPDANCRADCTRPRCGDGIADAGGGEDCDAGARNSDEAGAACSANCTRLCPALPPLDGATIEYSSGLAFPTAATYTCDGSGGPPADGDAARECQQDGRWSGVPPTRCETAVSTFCAEATSRVCGFGSCGPDNQLSTYEALAQAWCTVAGFTRAVTWQQHPGNDHTRANTFSGSSRDDIGSVSCSDSYATTNYGTSGDCLCLTDLVCA
eukprot:SAG11_NODE_2843_length_2915_cov_1.455966_2_plen_401_part_00